MKKILRILKSNFELIVWVFGLFTLGLIDPQQSHFSICIFHHLGIDFCTGCGIGNGISFLLHGQIHEGIATHWLSLPALIILLYRIVQLSVQLFLSYKNTKTTNVWIRTCSCRFQVWKPTNWYLLKTLLKT